MYSFLWKITVFGGHLFRDGHLFRQIRYIMARSIWLALEWRNNISWAFIPAKTMPRKRISLCVYLWERRLCKLRALISKNEHYVLVNNPVPSPLRDFRCGDSVSRAPGVSLAGLLDNSCVAVSSEWDAPRKWCVWTAAPDVSCGKMSTQRRRFDVNFTGIFDGARGLISERWWRTLGDLAFFRFWSDSWSMFRLSSGRAFGRRAANQSINQSMTQSINPSINQSIEQFSYDLLFRGTMTRAYDCEYPLGPKTSPSPANRPTWPPHCSPTRAVRCVHPNGHVSPRSSSCWVPRARPLRRRCVALDHPPFHSGRRFGRLHPIKGSYFAEPTERPREFGCAGRTRWGSRPWRCSSCNWASWEWRSRPARRRAYSSSFCCVKWTTEPREAAALPIKKIKHKLCYRPSLAFKWLFDCWID